MSRIERRSLLRCLGLAPIAFGALACEAERGSRPRDAAGPDPDGGTLDDAASDSGLDDAGLEDSAIPDSGHEHPASCTPTAEDVEGPFFRSGAPRRTTLVGPDEPGRKLAIEGHVLDADCRTPIRGALLDVWQADASGNYDTDSADYRLRAVLSSDDQGSFGFDTIRPGNYPDAGGMRPAHIHFTVVHPNYQPLTTQLYFAGDPFLAPNDSCGFCSSGDPTLILTLEQEIRDGVEWLVGHFDIVLRPV
jgi:catechol 1,2-dioxygenase